MEEYHFREFFNNPSGTRSTFLNLGAIKKEFDARYEVFKNKMRAESFFFQNGDIYLHIYFPSHSADNVFYDVVFSFAHKADGNTSNMNDMPMRIFSNSPSFIYTHAYSYMKHNLFIMPLKKKYSEKVLSNAAKAKNPRNTLSYDISVYASMKFIIENKLLSFNRAKEIIVGNNMNALLDRVQDAEKVLESRKNSINQAKSNKELQASDSTKDTKEEPEEKKTGIAALAKRTLFSKKTKTTKKI